MPSKSTLLWFRRDLRLGDHPALTAAAARGTVIPVFIHDDSVANLGAAPKWRLGLSLECLGAALEAKGSRLILRRGPALEVLEELIEETGVDAVYWSRLYDGTAQERDSRVKEELGNNGIEAKSFGGHVLFEPWTVATQQGNFYKVYTPFWKSVRDREVDTPLPAPDLTAPSEWPGSEALPDWELGAGMARGESIVRRFANPGESAAQSRLGAFMAQGVDEYATRRDLPAEDGTSNMSEHLTTGEISPAQLWHAALREEKDGKAGAETFRKELVWRDFAYHLLYHTPRLTEGNWREEWDAFPWNEDERRKEVTAWKQARTGIPIVDAGLREMYVTGRMHNRVRMNVASYLSKHLMCHWLIGLKWFEDCLIDWDIANNALGWQWAAGSGPDAAPYFRIFNPETQAKRFDPDHAYIKRWIAEGQENPSKDALSYFDAIPASWGLSPSDPYPAPIVSADEGRKRALDAYENRGF
ncbi:deoxyribodipyrimidine photo-lyase [Poseidonocella pacifica]|uniref:Deoxyribodipyrimidine photo-lyase n=1 Tax=Poseidonocella pacifica TaxID=871651 RepID=A0A1I0XCI4_9RHOB|nr:deoxyribodipyrimidine photo-lyase [Poseidonocella pacifica]SFA98050.1 deoxyribodipyrimidine photo-lyase [Poseidonocella pacifica]